MTPPSFSCLARGGQLSWAASASAAAFNLALCRAQSLPAAPGGHRQCTAAQGTWDLGATPGTVGREVIRPGRICFRKKRLAQRWASWHAFGAVSGGFWASNPMFGGAMVQS